MIGAGEARRPDLTQIPAGYWVRIDGFRTPRARLDAAGFRMFVGDQLLCHGERGDGRVNVERTDGWLVALVPDTAEAMEVTALRTEPTVWRPGPALPSL